MADYEHVQFFVIPLGDISLNHPLIETSNDFKQTHENSPAIGQMFGGDFLFLGSFTGLPSPPMNITLDLLPYMEKELIFMVQRVETTTNPLAMLVSNFQVD